MPWGTYNQVASTVSGSGNQTFKATKQQQIDKATYLYGTVNGKSGWVSKYYLTTPTQSKVAVSKPKTSTKAVSTNSKATTADRAAITQTSAKASNTNSTQTINKIAQVKANNSGIRASVFDKKLKVVQNMVTVLTSLRNNVLKVITHMSYFKIVLETRH